MKELASIYYQQILGKQDSLGQPANIHSGSIKQTFILFTDYMVNNGASGYIGRAAKRAQDIPCTGAIDCRPTYSGGNYAVIFDSTYPSVHAIVHELGHSFSLPHTFLSAGQSLHGGAHYSYRGYTDNIMDYNATADKPPIFNPHSQKATFKWQWNLLRNDRTINN